MKRGTMSKLYRCTVCGKKKQPTEFYKDSHSLSGIRADCKACHLEGKAKYRKDNRENINSRQNEFRKENTEFCQERDRKYYYKNIEESRIRKSANSVKRKAQKNNACPKWLSPTDLAKIKSVYKMAKNLYKKTGIIHHVDHIVPLQGENVSGLHVPWNLRVIPASDNCSKGNKLIEDIVYS
jgi:hypothetical protein